MSPLSSSPRAFAWPTALACVLRSARRRSTSTAQGLRFSSSALSALTSRTKPRRARLRATASGSERSSFGSITGLAFRWRARPQPRERLADFQFQPARYRTLVSPIRKFIRQVTLPGGEGIRLIVRIAIAAAEAQILHQPRGRVAQPQWYIQRTELRHILHRLAHRDIHGVALRRAREVHQRSGDRQLPLGG